MFQKISIIGAGTIGSIFTKYVSKTFPNANIFVCDRSEEKLIDLKKDYANLETCTDLAELPTDLDLIILAIKPQDFSNVAKAIKEKLTDKTVIVSVLAGTSIEKIANELGTQKIVRTMPNTAVRIGQGVLAWLKTEAVENETMNEVSKFLESMGFLFPCQNEEQIDKVTAIAGSGPAYVFYTLENFIKSAIELGFVEKESINLVKNTFFGATELLKQDFSPEKLKQQVMSKGGTTEAAINSLEESDFSSIWQKAIKAAYQRAKDLS